MCYLQSSQCVSRDFGLSTKQMCCVLYGTPASMTEMNFVGFIFGSLDREHAEWLTKHKEQHIGRSEWQFGCDYSCAQGKLLEEITLYNLKPNDQTWKVYMCPSVWLACLHKTCQPNNITGYRQLPRPSINPTSFTSSFHGYTFGMELRWKTKHIKIFDSNLFSTDHFFRLFFVYLYFS